MEADKKIYVFSFYYEKKLKWKISKRFWMNKNDMNLKNENIDWKMKWMKKNYFQPSHSKKKWQSGDTPN